MRPNLLTLLLVLLAAAQGNAAEPPARRIISLAPHAAELVYAAGAGPYLLASVAHSDYPPAARELPRIGDAARLDRERILGFQPDLVIAWPLGNRSQDLAWLEGLGIRVYRSDPQNLAAIADELEARRGDDGSWPSPRDRLLSEQITALRADVDAAIVRAQYYQRAGLLNEDGRARGSFGSVKEPIAMIDAFTQSWNEGASPFVWVKTADAILAKAVRKLPANSESGH